jgi:uncharacterized membrane protein YgcG
MKRILSLVVLTILLALPTQMASASYEGDMITNFQVAISVNPDSSLEISEGITYAHNTPGHGIWRAIPLLDNLPNNKQQLYTVNVLEILQDNAPAQFEQSADDNFIYLKIGNAATEISGEHTYVITYSVQGALRKISADTVDFYWDVIGDQWDVPILQASADIWLPGKYLSTNCTYGQSGSIQKCEDKSESDALHYTAPGLAVNGAMTVATQLPTSAFTSFTDPTIRDTPDPWAEFTASLPIGAALGAASAAGLLFWSRKRRNSTVTAAVHDFVRFEIPRNLRPAEIQAGWHGSVDARGFTATLLDLATRGIITLTLDEDENLVITRADPTKPMAAWETELLDQVLAGQFSVTLDGYQSRIATAVSSMSAQLVSNAEASGIRNARALERRVPHIIATVVFLVATVAAVFISVSSASLGGYLVPLFALSAVASIAGIFIVPKQQTQQSADFLSEVEGFKRALDTEAAADRRDFVQRSHLDPVGVFATMLPYAVIFDLEDSWTRQFPDLTPAQLSTYGLGFAGVGRLDDGIHHATSSITHAMTAPSSSGNGSSGGSSGGGGGGGGGGGW